MEKTLDFWKHSIKESAKPCEGGVIIPMQGYRRYEDFYLCVPAKGFHTRSGNSGRYGDFSYEYFFDGEFLGGGRIDKKDKIKMLCEAGHTNEALEYLKGYRYWRETELGGRHIIAGKERARISHAMCDMGGKAGHEMRQTIRKMIK